MSYLPELPLFEEIQDISNSFDFFTYTQDEFNKTWSYYEEETEMDTKEHSSLWNSPRCLPTPPSSGKSSPTRDAWDPMLWNTRSLEEVELRALAELGPLNPALSPSVSTVSSSDVTPVCDSSYKLIAITISAPDLSLSGCRTGSNQLQLRDQRSGASERAGDGESGSRRQCRGKPNKEESQIVSRKRGLNYPALGGNNKSLRPSLNRQRRKKLYEMKQFADPMREKERQNAINAKKNRDRKNSLVSKAQDQIDRLKAINKRLNKEATAEKRKLFAARKEIRLLKSKLQISSIHATRST